MIIVWCEIQLGVAVEMAKRSLWIPSHGIDADLVGSCIDLGEKCLCLSKTRRFFLMVRFPRSTPIVETTIFARSSQRAEMKAWVRASNEILCKRQSSEG